MRKLLMIFLGLFPIAGFAITATGPTGTDRGSPAAYISPASFNVMQPFLTPKMRAALQPPGTQSAPDPSGAWLTKSTGSNITPASDFAYPAGRRQLRNNSVTPPPPISQAARATAQPRNVVPRAIIIQEFGPSTANIARTATSVPTAAAGTRRVVQRNAAFENRQVPRSATNLTPNTTAPQLDASHCLSSYKECMNGYCRREGTLYDRCYCSPRLAQIDGRLQPAINGLVRQITAAQNGNFDITDEEMEALWQSTFFEHTGENSMADLNASLNSINWADAENRARGQNAFVAGHEFCSQHLRGCFYMASNMRDAYRSEISRDCTRYENYLEAIQSAAESLLEALKNP